MIVVMAGVSGSGKSTVGALLAGRLGWAFADGDSFHPAASVTKMTAGIPLTDEDRAALQAFEDEVIDRLYVLNAERAREEARLGVAPKKAGRADEDGVDRAAAAMPAA